MKENILYLCLDFDTENEMKRNIFNSLKLHLQKKEFTILTGARQIGKTTLLRQLEDFCRENKLPSLFLNLENKNILSELNAHPFNLINFLPADNERVVVFIDEIQYLQDPSNFLKLIYDEHAEKIKIVATGSSAFYIDDKFNDSLAGRKKIFSLRTCSFEEHLVLRNKEDLVQEMQRIFQNKTAKSAKINTLYSEWNSYMLYGGYPAVIIENNPEEKINHLKEIRDSFIKRDILESDVQNEEAFYNLFRIIASQPGNMINISELSNRLRIKNETVAHYLHVLQKCFHIALIKPFYRNIRKELTKMPKAYLMDTGLRNCLINNFQPMSMRLDKGELWENVYFRLLADKFPLDEIYFWRTTSDNEVDFVLPHSPSPYAVEVKYNESAIKHTKYRKFTETYPEIPLQFAWMEDFNEDFFRRI